MGGVGVGHTLRNREIARAIDAVVFLEGCMYVLVEYTVFQTTDVCCL